jgi:hypothetical protein
MRFKWLVGIALCAFLLGCDQATLMKNFTPPGDEAIARSYFDQLRQGEFDQIASHLDPSVAESDARDKLAEMASLIPGEMPLSAKVVGARVFRNRQYSTTSITLEYQFPTKWLLVDVTTRKKGDTSTVLGFHLTPQSDSLENLNRFTLVGKSRVQYSILVLAVCSLAFSFYALILCIRTKDLHKKWLWLLFILAGVEKVAVNWKTGELTFGILTINIPSATATRALYGPWIIAVFLPLGAILFLNRQRKMKISSEPIPPPAVAEGKGASA